MNSLVNFRDIHSVLQWCREERPLIRMIIAWDKYARCYVVREASRIAELDRSIYNIVIFTGGCVNGEE